MTRDEIRDLIDESRALWCGRQRAVLARLSPPEKKDLFNGWVEALKAVDYQDAVAALAQLRLEISPFEGRYEFVGQVIREYARRIAVARARKRDSELQLAMATRPAYQEVHTGSGGKVVREVQRRLDLEFGAWTLEDSGDRMARARELAKAFLEREGE